MLNSNVVAADRSAGKAGDKVLEKRRALGRGLDSLLPGPRAVSSQATPAPPAVATQPTPKIQPAAPVASAPDAAASFDHVGLDPVAPAPAHIAADDASPSAPRSSVSVAASSTDASAAGPSVIGELRASGETPQGEQVYALPIDSIDLNPYQTRSRFDEETLKELAESIRVQGLIQPIVVRPGKEEGRYTLVLGERRLRASGIAELETIPAVVKRVSEQQAAEMTVVENLQREDLNCVEQARAFANLSQAFQMTQEDIGKRVGLTRGVVSNYMRLLSLPSGVIEALYIGRLTYSHARLLSRLTDHAQIWALAKRVMEQKMSVEQLEAVMMGVPKPGKDPNKAAMARWMDPNVKAAQRSLEEILGMRVRIRDRAGRGRIVIDYSTIDDFERVVGMLRGK